MPRAGTVRVTTGRGDAPRITRWLGVGFGTLVLGLACVTFPAFGAVVALLYFIYGWFALKEQA
jgi:hypothetical protein